MDVRKFTVYSAAGSAVFTTFVTAIIYFGLQQLSRSPVVLAQLASDRVESFVTAYPLLALVVLGVLIVGVLVVWRTLDQYVSELLRPRRDSGSQREQ